MYNTNANNVTDDNECEYVEECNVCIFNVYEQYAPVIIIRSKYFLCLMLQYLHKCVKNLRPIKPFEKYCPAFMAACCLAHRTIAKGLLS